MKEGHHGSVLPALVGEWDKMERYTMGGDHVPILSRFGGSLVRKQDKLRIFNYSGQVL